MIRYIARELLDCMDAFFFCLPGRMGRILRRNYLAGRLRKLGASSSIGTGFQVLGPGSVSIGTHFASAGGTFISAEGGKVVFGDHVAFNTNVHVNASVGGEIEIGNHVMIGPNCVLRASDHAFADLDLPIQMQGHRPGKIVLEDDVSLGANVVVVPGVCIGQGAVVAPGAVVTKDVEPGSIVGGVPARFIKKRGSLDSSFL